MFSLSRAKSTQSTLSLTSRRSSNEEFDDCFSQMGSPISPSRYNYQDRVLSLFIPQQRSDCTSSSSSSSSTSPCPENTTGLGVSFFTGFTISGPIDKTAMRKFDFVFKSAILFAAFFFFITKE